MSESAKQAPQKPVPPPLAESSQLPHELTDLPRWVAWLYDLRGGPDWAKQPYTPATGQWKGWQKGATTFEEACKGAVKFHGDGVGFKPEPDDPYILVDFDDVLKDGVLDAVVAMWLKWFPTYTEISPSGHGLRLVVKGHLPYTITNTKLPGSDKASVELYDGHSGRYVTITGNHWGEPHLEIEEDQIGIDKLLTAIGYDPTKVPASAPEDNDRPTTLEHIRAVYEKHLEKFRAMKLSTDSQNDQLNICSLLAARGFLTGAFEKTEEQLKSDLRAIAASSGHCPGIDRTLDSGWDAGIAKGAFILQENVAKAALKYLDALLSG